MELILPTAPCRNPHNYAIKQCHGAWFALWGNQKRTKKKREEQEQQKKTKGQKRKVSIGLLVFCLLSSVYSSIIFTSYYDICWWRLGGEAGSGPTMLAAIMLFRFPTLILPLPFTRQYFLCPRAAPEKAVNLHGWHACTNYNFT